MDYDLTDITDGYDRGRDLLAQLSPNDFQAGMDALRGHAARVRDTAVIEPIDVFVFRS